MSYVDQSVQVGDLVNYSVGSDLFPAVVISLTPKRLKVRTMKATLLNGVNSGEPDALEFSPGGFVGHTSGTQRWDITEDEDGTVRAFSWREKKGQWRMTGFDNSRLYVGVRHNYDFNF